MENAYKFSKLWNDAESVEKLKALSKSKEVQVLEVEHHLKGMSLRYERSPQPGTLKLWAQDIIDAGYNESVVREVCKTIPYKFEKHPTLAQVMELLRPYLAQVQVLEDDLDKYTRLAIPHLKAKFIELVGEEAFIRMVEYYKKAAFNSPHNPEICMLGDWCRSYLGKPEKIIEQGKLSNEMADIRDRDYFLRPLRQYCEKNNLIN